MKSPFFLWWLPLLTACGGGGDGLTPVASSPLSFCGFNTGSGRISGRVSSVHDGDTLTLNDQTIRLDSIDAPELAQAYGVASRDQLSAAVLNQTVTVTFSQKDAYNRVLGTVFKPDCSNINLRQVNTGSAWFYAAYQCEVEIRLRQAYAAAQASAESANKGLWASPAVAPWIYRNGVAPKIPATCPNGDAPSD